MTERPPIESSRLTVISRILLAGIFAGAGVLHIARPGLYRPIMPSVLPAHDALILVSGLAQLAGAIGLLIPRTRRAAAVGLVLLLLAVFPANVEMLRLYRARNVVWWAELLLWLRLPLQALLIWWAWWAGSLTWRAASAALGVGRETNAARPR